MYEWLIIDGPICFKRYANLIYPSFSTQMQEDLWQVVSWYEQLYASPETPNLDEIDFLIAYTKASDYIGAVGFDLCSSLSRWKERIIAEIPEKNPFYPESET